jgi:diguanylate cyclase (GGDEF)-like protein
VELARSTQPDAVLLDIRMPDIDGLEVCAVLREKVAPGLLLPLIVFTSGSSARAERLSALRAGAWEFCSQPLDGEVLLHKLRTYVETKRAADRTRDDSLVDQATGLYNLRGLSRRAREIGADSSRRRAPLTCVALLADTDPPLQYGERQEEVTARVVTQLAAVCRRSGRASDAIGRLGRSDFAVIAPDTDAMGAVCLVDRLRTSIEAAPIEVDGVERRMRVRAGYCTVSNFAESSVDAIEMLMRATTALRRLCEEDSERYIRAFEQTASLSFVP